MEQTDVLIIGTGVAGLFCALSLPEQLKVRMITKDEIENSDSFLAQGGISTLKTPGDYADYYEDTVKAGHYKNNPESVETMIRKSPQIIEELIDLGVDFERTKDGLSYAREGGHSQARILHHKDITGQEIMETLLEHVIKRKNIQITGFTKMIDIVYENNTCKGVVVETRRKDIQAMYAKVVVLATGGIGGLFRHSTNFKHITGDALAIALLHNIEVQDVQYIQIHPTTFYSKATGRRFLISEAARGEGAVLLNPDGERFTDELQPRDVVTAAIKKEMRKFGTEYVYLSLQHVDPDIIKSKLPNIYKYCLEQGYDLTKDKIPVTPAQHYFMGGIKVDLRGRTSMQNLFAIGETSCNRVHGANRLGSNSLLESLVFSKRAAKVIGKEVTAIPWAPIEVDLTIYHPEEIQAKYKEVIMDEIKRRDGAFYEQWCSDEA